MLSPFRLGNTFAPYSFRNININAFNVIVNIKTIFLLLLFKNLAAINVDIMLKSMNINY